VSRAYKTGQHVYSARYGRGEILAVDGYGEKEKLTISFESSGLKEVLSHYFVLEPYDNEAHSEAALAAAAAAAATREEAEVEERAEAPPEAGAERPPAAVHRGNELKEALREVIREELGAAEIRIHPKWKGGSMSLRPGKGGLREKDLPIEEFFHKIVMVRDRLRTLEQRVNAHPRLDEAEKVELQQYVTRIYGSLTTFNILFADREDWFVGQKGAEE